jgi:hypothetical protein
MFQLLPCLKFLINDNVHAPFRDYGKSPLKSQCVQSNLAPWPRAPS